MLDKREILFLFTTSFPYGKGEQFIETEIKYLSEAFKRVFIIPESIDNRKRYIPNNVEVISEFAEEFLFERRYRFFRYLRGLKALNKNEFKKEILERNNVLYNPTSLFNLISWITRAYTYYSWSLNFLREIKIDPQRLVFYTYWFNYRTYGIAKLKNKFRDIKVITRAHNTDLYENLYIYNYFPLRKQTLNLIDKVFLISEHGKKYIESLYPLYKEKFTVSRLGTEDPGFLSKPSAKNKISIASCSFAVSVKRIDLIIKGIAMCANKYKEIKFEWHYIGDGPLKKSLDNLAFSTFPKNVTYYSYGLIPNKEVFDVYRENNIDVFINTSKSEGLPVSIMEAQSCGIPVIATSVGGTPEIVDNENGLLLSENPSIEEISIALADVIVNREKWLDKRQKSRLNWESRYNAYCNYNEFIDMLRRL